MSTTAYSVLAQEQYSIPYRKHLRKVTGSINSAILLQQMCYNWERSSRNGVFYKFKESCENPKYRLGDSWLEELGFSRKEYDTAMEKIGTMANSRSEIKALLQRPEKEFCVIRFKDSNNVTWFYRNDIALGNVLDEMTRLSREASIAEALNQEASILDPLTQEQLEDGSAVYTEVYPESPKGDVRKPDLVSPLSPKTTSKNDSTRGNGKIVYEAKEPKPAKVPKQKSFDRRFKDGLRMTPEFDIPSDVINDTIEMGYDARDVMEEKVKYLNYYKKGEGRTKIHWDWIHNFVFGWLDRGFKKGYLKRHGEFYTVSANTDRLTKLEEHSKPLFSGFGD